MPKGTAREQKQMKNKGRRVEAAAGGGAGGGVMALFFSKPNWSRIKEMQLSISQSFGRGEKGKNEVGRRVGDSKSLLGSSVTRGKF